MKVNSVTGALPALDAWTLVIAVIALGSVSNGIWMLLAPGHWYVQIPAGVPDTGPLNVHFVRDIGCAFLSVGVALAWAALRPDLRRPLVSIACFFYLAHALLHVHDTLRGIVDADHWLLDLPGVYLPALILAAATLRFWRLRGEAG